MIWMILDGHFYKTSKAGRSVLILPHICSSDSLWKSLGYQIAICWSLKLCYFLPMFHENGAPEVEDQHRVFSKYFLLHMYFHHQMHQERTKSNTCFDSHDFNFEKIYICLLPQFIAIEITFESLVWFWYIFLNEIKTWLMTLT